MTVKWTPEDFVGLSAPDSVSQYLMDLGLPEVVPFTTLEFGPSEPEGGDLVIGCDLDWPIVLDSEGTVHVLYESGSWFFNSTVQLLATSIDEYLKMKECDEDGVACSVERFRSFLSIMDPRCLTEKCSVWRSILGDFEVMAT